MRKNKKQQRDPLPDEFSSAEEAGEFWDTHSGVDYEEYMKPAHFEVDLRRRAQEVRIADEVISQVKKIARKQGLKPETLINIWLKEKVSGHSPPSKRTAKQAARKRPVKATTRSQNGIARTHRG